MNAMLPMHSSFAEEKIAYGDEVEASDPIAHMTVAIASGTSLNKMDSQCSGVILDSSHVVTAGHCVDESPLGYIIFARRYAFSNLFPALFKVPALSFWFFTD